MTEEIRKPDMRDSNRTETTKAAEREIGRAPFARAEKTPEPALKLERTNERRPIADGTIEP